MKVLIIIVSLSLVAIGNCDLKLQESPETLKLVHVFFRHGSRTPEFKDTYPNDPYKLKDFMPMGWGQLTNAGKQRAYKLGKMLRQRYDSFLGDIYTSEMVSTTSTDFDRTKMTALLVLAGLFPPSPSQQWDDELSWLPIPYYFEKGEQDFFIRRPTAYCPTYAKELDEVIISPIGQRMLKENRETLEYISENTGKKVTSLIDAFRIYQTLNAEENMNLTLPQWTEEIYPKKVHELAAMRCHLENYNAVLKRLNGGRILKRVIEHMKAKAGIATNTHNLIPNERKIYLYSGHENNVINILAAMDLFVPHVPKYSAAVIIELHFFKEFELWAVKVLYAREVNAEPEVQSLEGCNTLCPLNDFIDITSPHVPTNYTAECASVTYLG